MAPVRIPRDDEDEDMQLAVPMAAAFNQDTTTPMSARVGAPQQAPGGGLRETPIDMQSPHYGLPETRTAVLTQTSYLAVIPPDLVGNTTQFRIRLNTPVDWFFTTTLTSAAAGATYSAGLYTNLMRTNNSNVWSTPPFNFPTTLSALERPQWRTYWESHYQYYTVLGLEYKMTFHNPQQNPGCDMVVATFTDSFSTTNANNVHPLNASMQVMENWPDVTFRRVSSAGDNDFSKAYETIKGYWRPGQVKSSVENDEDIRTWTKVGSLPSLTEMLTVSVSKAWDNTVATTGLNVRMDMRWIVQYKDLAPQYRWPTSGQTSIAVVAPSDILFTS